MKRIAREYEFTAAAAKARQHLERLGEAWEPENELMREEPEEKPKKESASETNRKKRRSSRNLPASEQFREFD
jgi:DNA-directed RNA polymerase alpha subunit